MTFSDVKLLIVPSSFLTFILIPIVHTPSFLVLRYNIPVCSPFTEMSFTGNSVLALFSLSEIEIYYFNNNNIYTLPFSNLNHSLCFLALPLTSNSTTGLEIPPLILVIVYFTSV